MNCQSCGSWTVRGAYFCFRCGTELRAGGTSTFNYEAAGAPVSAVSPAYHPHWKDKAATTLLLTLATATGSLFAGWEPSYIGLVPLGYLLWTPTSKVIIEALGRLPDREPTPAGIIRVEHIEDGGKRWHIAELPETIRMSQLRHVARRTLDDNKPFSRRQMLRSGVLSQTQYETLRDWFLTNNYAFFVNEGDPRQGVALTERARRLLKKSLTTTPLPR